MSGSAPLLSHATAIFQEDYLSREVIDGELWIQFRDEQWGILGTSKPRSGPCTYCGHARSDSCFRPGEALEAHESRCSGLSLCPETRPTWCDRHHYYAPDQQWGVTKKGICSKCYQKNRVGIGLTTNPLVEPDSCEDCNNPATQLVLLAADAYTSIVDYEIFPPGEG